MKQKLHELYRNVSLLTKIRIIILVLSALLCGLILAATFLFYNTVTGRSFSSNAVQAAANAYSTMSVNEDSIMQRFVSICGSEEFTADIIKTAESPANVSAHANDLQQELNDLSNCSYLVSSALIMSGDGEYAYPSFRIPIMIPAKEIFPDQELSGIRGITYLPSRTNPFITTSYAIPMVIPLKLVNNLLQVNLDSNRNVAYVILFLDEEKLNHSLNLAGTADENMTFFLVSSAGTPITHLGESPATPAGMNAIDTLIRKASGSGLLEYTEQSSKGITILHSLSRENAYLVSHTTRQDLKKLAGRALYSLIFAILLIFAIIFVISFFITNYVTKPLKKLVEVVNLIQQDRYTEPLHFDTNDEVGRLLQSINRMYDTIQEQIVRIKHEESLKYASELKLLTEQINPHFLYNTLEEIQSEVMRSEKDTAGRMIQYLAEYLRIGLSGGSDIIPIPSEIRHANAYVAIMNQRFGQSILFMYKADPALNDRMILKTILQPLMENSIRHGFGIDSPGVPSSVPTIEVSFSLPEGTDSDELLLEITDNGSGFDPAEVLRIMTDLSPNAVHTHIGINNVYRRLINYYGAGRIRIDLDSIPYYRNTISIRIRDFLRSR